MHPSPPQTSRPQIPSHPLGPQMLSHSTPSPVPTPRVTIAVMGATGSGKSTLISIASGSNLRVGMALESRTAGVCVVDEFTLNGTAVSLIDTPGFDDTATSDGEILKLIVSFLYSTHGEGTTLAGIIYIHRISDTRFGGITGRTFSMFRKLCGEPTLKNVILVTNMWGLGPQETNEAREKDLSARFFKPALDKGAQMVRHDNTTESAHNIIQRIIRNHTVVS